MPEEFLTINESIALIRERGYDPRMTRIKFHWQSKQGWFEVVEYPGNRPRIKLQSIIDAYENPRPSRLYPYKGRSEPGKELTEQSKKEVEAFRARYQEKARNTNKDRYAKYWAEIEERKRLVKEWVDAQQAEPTVEQGAALEQGEEVQAAE